MAKTDAGLIPGVGNGVHYVLDGEAQSVGTHRPAVIIGAEGETLQLLIFTSSDDGPRYAAHVAERQAVTHDEDAKAPGTWHWPE